MATADELLRELERRISGGPTFAPVDSVDAMYLMARTVARALIDEWNPPVTVGIVPGEDRYLTRIVTVEDTTIPVNGPNFPLPPGAEVSVKMRRPSSGNPTGYVGGTYEETKNSGQRNELVAGEPINGIPVSNFNRLWFLADTTSVVFEISAVVPSSGLEGQTL